MASSSRLRGGVDRVLLKLRRNIEAGNYYEAHQMYRTLYFRYVAQKQYAELLDLLHDGATELLIHDQHGSGADLAMLFVSVLTKSDVSVTDRILERSARLHSMMSVDAPERMSFLSACLKWSSQATAAAAGGSSADRKFGHPRLHQLVALTLWKEKNYQQSCYHFLRSMDGDGFAAMLVEYHTSQGYSSEVDLFIAQAVLQYLCLQNRVTAGIVFFRYTEIHPSIRQGPPFLLPLLNFLWFLLLVVESGKLPAFTVLCDQYQTTIRRDPAYSQYLEKIGQLFFGLTLPKRRNTNVLSDFLQSFLSGLDDDGSDDDDDGASSMQQQQQQLLQSEDLD